MMTMKNCAARSVMSAPEMVTAIAMTRRWAPSSRQSNLSRTLGLKQPVPDAADRLDVARTGRIIAQLLPQLADVHVDRAVDDDGLVKGVDVGQKLFAAEHPSRKFHQRLEQFVLDHGEADFAPGDEDLVPLDVQRQIPAHDLRRGLGALSGTPQDGVDARDEFTRTEGLGDVVVRAHSQDRKSTRLNSS